MKLSKYVAALIASLLMSSAAMAAPTQPNVIMILIDDMGWSDSSTYGSTYYQTPNLTRLANEGMLFTNAYAASPLCSPTRASIMSGQYPARLRITAAITPKNVPDPISIEPKPDEYVGRVQNKNHLPLEIYTLPEALKEKGYNTAHIGKWHLAPSGERFSGVDSTYNAENQGFDFVIGGAHLPGPPDYYSPYTRGTNKRGINNLTPGPEGEYLNERLAQESIKWISSVKDSGKPFYLNFWHYAVHGPIIPKKDLLPKYNALRDPEANQRCPEMATMLESMDTSIGMLLDWLDKTENSDLKKNTVIILTSDNGGVIHNDIDGNRWTSNRPLRGGKANTYEGGTRVPWLVRWPETVKAKTVCETSVQSLDIYPTVLDLAGAKPNADQPLDGQSLLPLLKGKPMNHQPIFTDFQHNMGILNAASSSVRVGDYKLIRYYYAGENTASHAYELFDLKRDLPESINLADYLPKKAKELDSLIEAHLKDTNALLPIPNTAYADNPRASRTNPEKAPNRPQTLSLSKTTIKTLEAGKQHIQLTDQDGKPRKTHALVLEGSEWVQVKNKADGSVVVKWDTPPKNASAKVLFGWSGGATQWEIDDWTHPPNELDIRASK